jgi:hypothetical protein
MAHCPQPETAVNDAALSIVSRMKRRLSIARACRAGGSPSSTGRKRVSLTTAIERTIRLFGNFVKNFIMQSRESKNQAAVRAGNGGANRWN